MHSVHAVCNGLPPDITEAAAVAVAAVAAAKTAAESNSYNAHEVH